MKRTIFLIVILMALVAGSLGGCKATGRNTPSPSPSLNPAPFTSQAAETVAPKVAAVSPADRAVYIPVNSTISATFSEAMDPASINTGVFVLLQGTEQIEGVVSYAGLTAVFTPAAALVLYKSYTASISQGARDLAGNRLAENYAWSFTTGVPIVVTKPAPPATPAATPATATPTATIKADTSAPTVLSVSPEKDARGVAIDSSISVTFSENMDASSLTAATFKLDGEIKGSLQYSQNKAVFTPAVPLEYDSLYSARVTTGAKDEAGNRLAAEYAWSFRTAAKPDATAPTVKSVSPASQSSGAALNTSVIAVFSEEIDPGTVATGTFTLGTGSTAINGTLSCTGATATFKPAGDLHYSTTYTARLTTGVKDLAGNALATDYQWSFSTLAPPSGGGGGGGGGPPPTTQAIKTATMTDADLPPSPSEGMTLGFVSPTSDDGTAQIMLKYSFLSYSVFLGVTGGKLWLYHFPKREDVDPSLLVYYDALAIDSCAAYNEVDGLYWFFALPSWLDIAKYDPQVTRLPEFVSIQSSAGKVTVRYKIKN